MSLTQQSGEKSTKVRPPYIRLAVLGVAASLFLVFVPGHVSGSEATGRDAPPAVAGVEERVVAQQVGPYSLYLPIVEKGSSSSGCPTSSTASFTAIPVQDYGPVDHPDSLHADLNLSLRGWETNSAALDFVSGSDTPDPDAPQMPGLFADNRVPAFTSTHQVYDWDWDCDGQPHGCRGALLTQYEVTLLGMGTTPGESIRIPNRVPEIYGGSFKAMVLYAEEQRITLVYVRQDSVAFGYAVHIENVCVDPNLLSLYQSLNGAGRGWLPGLHNDETLGTAAGSEILVAVRDIGTFLDPRSHDDWWQGR